MKLTNDDGLSGYSPDENSRDSLPLIYAGKIFLGKIRLGMIVLEAPHH